MKKLIFVASALAALSLLAPSAGFAAGANNQIGLYTDATGDFNTASIMDPAGAFTVYVVLTNPYNEDSSTVVTAVSGFEFQLVLPTGLFVTATVFPPQGINIGVAPDYIVGIGSPIAPTGANNAVVLVTFTMAALDANPKEIFLAPTSNPSIPGVMVIVDKTSGTSLKVTAYPSSGDYANPVFGVNTGVVANQAESWGGVKALFR